MSSMWVVLPKIIIIFAKSEPVAIINALWVELKKKKKKKKCYLKLIVMFR